MKKFVLLLALMMAIVSATPLPGLAEVETQARASEQIVRVKDSDTQITLPEEYYYKGSLFGIDMYQSKTTGAQIGLTTSKYKNFDEWLVKLQSNGQTVIAQNINGIDTLIGRSDKGRNGYTLQCVYFRNDVSYCIIAQYVPEDQIENTLRIIVSLEVISSSSDQPGRARTVDILDSGATIAIPSEGFVLLTETETSTQYYNINTGESIWFHKVDYQPLEEQVNKYFYDNIRDFTISGIEVKTGRWNGDTNMQIAVFNTDDASYQIEYRYKTSDDDWTLLFDILPTLKMDKTSGSDTPARRIPGDANDDGDVDVNDALRILQYGAGEKVEINLDNADVDANDTADIQDALCILQYLAGWNVVLR